MTRLPHAPRDPAPEALEEPDEGLPAYLITLSDMMTLLFTFFVALLALATLVPEQRAALTASIRQSFPAVGGAAVVGETGAPGTGAGAADGAQAARAGRSGQAAGAALQAGDSAVAYRAVQERLQRAGGVEVVPQRTGVLIRVNSALLFPSGSDRLHPEGEQLVAAIAAALADLPGEIRVEGHTDDVPIQTERFPSNWELSAARAARVVRAFTESYGIDPRRVVLAAYAEQRPLVPNDSPEHRQRNRRVEVYLITDVR